MLIGAAEHKKLLRDTRRAVRLWYKHHPDSSKNNWQVILAQAANKRLESYGLPPRHGQDERYDSLLAKPAIKKLLRENHCLASLFEVLGEGRRTEAKDSIQIADKRTTESALAAFSQVFTPPHIVQEILRQCLVEPFFSKDLSLQTLEELRILDPCCGAGNFLVAALLALIPLYEQFALPKEEAIKRVLRNNLWGLDIDSDSLWVAAEALTVESLILAPHKFSSQHNFTHNLKVIDSQANYGLGSLDPDLPLYKQIKFDVIVTNPPYLGRKLLSRQLKEKLKKHYPKVAHDLGQAFLWQALSLCREGGKIGFLTQSSFLSLGSAKPLRQHVLENSSINSIVHLGHGVFPLLSGEKAHSAVIVLTAGRAKDDFVASFQNLQSDQDAVFRRQSSLAANPDLSFNFIRPAQVASLTGLSGADTLDSVADFKQGLATTDNDRFLRYAWELAPGAHDWVPYAKGGGAERWWRTIDTRVLWQERGQAIKEAVAASYPYLRGKTNWVVKNEDSYFKAGLTFSFISRTRLSVRLLPAGAIFDVGGSAIFSKRPEEDKYLLAYLNSSLASAFACDINPTINFQVGDLKRIPKLEASLDEREKLAALAEQCIAIKKEWEMLTSATAAATAMAQGTFENWPAISEDDFEQSQKRINSLNTALAAKEAKVDELVLQIAARQLHLDSAARKDVDKWIDSLSGRESRSETPDKKLYAAKKMALRLYELAQNSDRPRAIDTVTDFFSASECIALTQMLQEDLSLFISTKLNRQLLELFSQPPVLVAHGRKPWLLCTRRALHVSDYLPAELSHLRQAQRPKALYKLV
jgi:methylase of polypeptide subunit release factors